MNYKELFNRYKNDLVNDDEKELIEQEIEKFEALEEYLSEGLDEEFDVHGNISNFEYQKEETNSLKKSVNSRLRKVVFTSVMIVIVLYIIVFYLISDIVDRQYYDPTSVTQSDEGYKLADIDYDMQAYVSLNMPGYSTYSFVSKVPKGFGKYEVSYSLRDLFTENEKEYFANFSRENLTYGIDGIFSMENRFGIWEGFDKIKYYVIENGIELGDNEVKRKNKETLRYLNELNPLSYISMSIVFDRDLTMEEFYELSKENSSLDFRWVGIRTMEKGTSWSEKQPMHLIGFDPTLAGPSSNIGPDSKEYPLFYLLNMKDNLVSEKTYYSEAYGIHFKSRLKYLRNQEDFVKIFDYNYYKTDFYDNALKYIDKNGIKTYGVLVFGTAEEFLDKIDKIAYDSLYINKVLPTKPNIYND